MNIPIPPAKVTPLFAVVAMFLMAASYMVFLYASWQSYQKDRTTRDDKINQLLDRLPQRDSKPASADD